MKKLKNGYHLCGDNKMIKLCLISLDLISIRVQHGEIKINREDRTSLKGGVELQLCFRDWKQNMITCLCIMFIKLNIVTFSNSFDVIFKIIMKLNTATFAKCMSKHNFSEISFERTLSYRNFLKIVITPQVNTTHTHTERASSYSNIILHILFIYIMPRLHYT